VKRFERTMAPHLRPAASVQRVMGEVLAALVPATVAYVWYFGPGLLLNMTVATLVALGAEAAVLAARGRSVAPRLQDLTAVLSAILLAFALPPLTPWWITATGTVFAIVFAKQLYGGLGDNPPR
jgi:electron transport complex protein RnfD